MQSWKVLKRRRSTCRSCGAGRLWNGVAGGEWCLGSEAGGWLVELGLKRVLEVSFSVGGVGGKMGFALGELWCSCYAFYAVEVFVECEYFGYVVCFHDVDG